MVVEEIINVLMMMKHCRGVLAIRPVEAYEGLYRAIE